MVIKSKGYLKRLNNFFIADLKQLRFRLGQTEGIGCHTSYCRWPKSQIPKITALTLLVLWAERIDYDWIKQTNNINPIHVCIRHSKRLRNAYVPVRLVWYTASFYINP